MFLLYTAYIVIADKKEENCVYYIQIEKGIGCFADRLIESVYFPVERTIPEEMKKELNVYYGRKEE